MNLKQQFKNNKHLILAFIFIILVSIYSAFSETNKKNDELQSSTPEIDTIIPKGYVLVPLELENHEAISSVIRSHGIVDLFSGQPENRSSIKIATKVKVIRAPYNPNLFAALVKESFSKVLMAQNNKMFAVIQNTNTEEGSNEVTSVVAKKNITINYQN